MTRTCDLMWVGVPTVTPASTSHRSRVGASLLTAVRLPELVAQTSQEYVEDPPTLAGELPRLRALRSSLRDRMAAYALCAGPGLARRVEEAYRLMCRGRH